VRADFLANQALGQLSRIAHALAYPVMAQQAGVPGNDGVRAVPQAVLDDLDLGNVRHCLHLAQAFEQVAAVLRVKRHVGLAVEQDQVQLAHGAAGLGKGPEAPDQAFVFRHGAKVCRQLRARLPGCSGTSAT
jgi:hypothetical protein